MNVYTLLGNALQLLGEFEDLEDPLHGARLRDDLEHYDEAVRLAATVNKLKTAADRLKLDAKRAAIERLEDEELDGAPTTIDGQRVNFSKYEFRAAKIADYEAFAKWAAEEEGETYFEPEARVRGELINALAKQREDDGEPLPPGLTLWRETRLSRTAQGAPAEGGE